MLEAMSDAALHRLVVPQSLLTTCIIRAGAWNVRCRQAETKDASVSLDEGNGILSAKNDRHLFKIWPIVPHYQQMY